jgi:hypothetical protein
MTNKTETENSSGVDKELVAMFLKIVTRAAPDKIGSGPGQIINMESKKKMKGS